MRCRYFPVTSRHSEEADGQIEPVSLVSKTNNSMKAQKSDHDVTRSFRSHTYMHWAFHSGYHRDIPTSLLQYKVALPFDESHYQSLCVRNFQMKS